MTKPATPRVRFSSGIARERRPTLEKALRRAMASTSESWTIDVSTSLVYLTPALGRWGLSLHVELAAGERFKVVLDPDHQTPKDVEDWLKAEMERRHGNAPARLAPARAKKGLDRTR
jgi:hypothetical protein